MAMQMPDRRTVTMDEPLWFFWPPGGELHLFGARFRKTALTLCDKRLPEAELSEPENEDQSRCEQCLFKHGEQLREKRRLTTEPVTRTREGGLGD